MQEGAIAMLDALGFKGAWERYDADAVIERLRALQKNIEDLAASATKHLAGLAGPHALPEPPVGSALFLSDTIVFALSSSTKGLDGIENAKLSLGIHAAMTAFVLKACGLIVAGGVHHRSIPSGAAPLNYRGAVTWGHFTIDGNFLIGPAVDEVATLQGRADGAVVQVTPPALHHLNAVDPVTFPAPLRAGRLVVEHDIPLKCGHSERGWILNPFSVCSEPSELHDVTDGIKRAFGPEGQTKHAAKYRNTLEALSVGRRAFLENYEREAD